MENKLREYAALLVEVGLSVKQGQTLIIHAPVDCADFARMCMEQAYKSGASEVVVAYSDDAVARAKFLYAADEVFDRVPEWQKHLYNDYAEQGASMLFIAASDPENLKGADPDRILRSNRARGVALEVFRRLEITNGFPWCIASVPIPSWAKKVFPDQSEDDAMAALWEAIFAAVRVEGDGGATARWRDHLAALKARTERLNEYHFRTLYYKNGIGTDLTVRLPEDHIWISGEEHAPDGHSFVANMPTEEIFTSPLKEGVDGVVVSAMPLVNNGTVIRNFSMRLEKGKIVEVHAEEGETELKNAVSVDEGAAYFGEVALIPYDSPIRNQGILYYETLFDENASCHFAFGDAYPCITGGSDMTPEELCAHGLNHSATHVDFMIGTRDLSIVGETYDGERITVFENGNFAI